MKKQIITHVCRLFCASTLISTSFCQTTAMLPKTVFDAKNNLEYTLAAADNMPPASAAIPFTAVAPKVQKSFDRSFTEVRDAHWYVLDKHTYLAMFTNKDGRDSRAFFSKNGYIDYVINKGNEQSLPKEERRLLKSSYVDYNIGKVSEINAAGEKVWVVNLQDADNLIVARIADKSLDELAHYQTHAAGRKFRQGKIIIPQ